MKKNKRIADRKSSKFWGIFKKIVLKVVPVSSYVYKKMHLKAVELTSSRRNTKKNKLSFDVSVVDSCNLNCVGCVAFSPLCKDVYIDVSSFEKDIKRIGELANGEVGYISLSGGEVLQHPKLIEILDITRKYLKKGDLSIITNGILLDKQSDMFWNTCRKNNVKIYITPYPIKLNIDKIIELAKEYLISVEWFSVGERDHFRKLPLNIKGDGDVSKNFRRCNNSNTCVVLRDGKIYPCGSPAVIKYFNEYFDQHFKVRDKDYIDIYTTNDIDEILDFVCKPIPFCRYCDIDNMKFGIAWRVSKKDIKEWI